MSISLDFPANCSTNVHILHDFAEIAYIVCTHAIPATTDNIVDANSPSKILDRLRNAEKQFRQNSILVALDVDSLELFTFYRKVDVVKDQRTILSKFGYVCRLNSCIISSKSAARVLELLKPESSRIYRLFASAVLSSIHILPRGSGSAIAVGTRTFLTSLVEGHRHEPGHSASYCPEWQMCRVNLQVIASGQLVLTVQCARSGPVRLLADVIEAQNPPIIAKGSLLYLTPTGQMARLRNGSSVSKTDLSHPTKAVLPFDQGDAKKAVFQIEKTTNWLKLNYPNFAADVLEETRWVQVEIAIFEPNKSHGTHSEKTVLWKPLLWPSTLTYVFPMPTTKQTHSGPSASEVDPLKFAMDWLDGTTERAGEMKRAQHSKDHKDDTDDEHVFSDEVHFEDSFNPQLLGPPTFPAGQLVYPTPPEAIPTHQTPGMSSVDGLAPTPAANVNVIQPEHDSFLDQEMTDLQEQHQEDHAGTGFYDEDLFDEVPEDKLAPIADGDEPNWDFFDPPGFETHEGEINLDIVPEDEKEARNEYTAVDDDFPALATLIQENSIKQMIADDEDDLSKISPGKVGSIYANDISTSPLMMHQNEYVGQSTVQNLHSRTTAIIGGQYGSEQIQTPVRRRLSIFDNVPITTGLNDHDSRYDKHGKFWFDYTQNVDFKGITLLNQELDKRPLSSGSETSKYSTASSSNISLPIHTKQSHTHKRTWTEYEPLNASIEDAPVDDLSTLDMDIEIENLLTAIGTASGEDPFLTEIHPLLIARQKPTFTSEKALKVAQLLIGQAAQSSILRDDNQFHLDVAMSRKQIDISMDHSGARSMISHATLADLTSVPPRTNPRVNSLSARFICASRSDSKFVARPSILPFWDTLGLQPYGEPKDVIAYCIHPRGTNVADGCVAFLNRFSETYTSCNLGAHTTGELPGHVHGGLLAWTPQSIPGPNLKQICQRLGSSIGSNASQAGMKSVVYMVSPRKDAACYREICHAFTFLLDAFTESIDGTKTAVEPILQVVPLDFVALPDTLAVPDQMSYLQLAIEVYDRLQSNVIESAIAACGSAVILEDYRLRDPSFELSATIMSPVSKDGPCLHLAYSYSFDKKWLIAVWTDERGLLAFTATYCLSVAGGETSHSRREVFRGMWDVSHDIMNRSRTKWRLVVAHDKFYEVEDTNEWQHLLSQGTDECKLMHRLILINIDLKSDLSVEQSGITLKPGHLHTISQASNLSGTPATTPQAMMTSPEQMIAATPTSASMPHASVSTPPDHGLESGHENETMLIDPTDQVWAVQFSFGLNQSPNFLDVRPAAASGLLIKRTNPRDDNRSLQLLGVNLVAVLRTQPGPLSMQEREALLLDIMEQYRGLITLAISRGCIDKNRECVPWHVAVAIKGAGILSETM